MGGEDVDLLAEATMIGTIAKFAAYAKAPRAAFTMMHPLEAAKYGAIYMVVRSVMERGK